MMPQDRPPRVVIEAVRPEIDGGRFPVKRTAGERVVVEADIFADGHDGLAAVLRHRRLEEPGWSETPMVPLVNDRWRGEFAAQDAGRYRYTVVAWVDAFATWRRDLARRVAAGQDVTVDLGIGAALVEAAGRRATGDDAARLLAAASLLAAGDRAGADLALGEGLPALMAAHPDRSRATAYARELEVVVDRDRARFSAWYEMFPRSCAPEPGRHGTLRDCEERLAYVASLGFDVLYLPPIHPIGVAHRKGRNNAPVAEPGDPGSPWAIGGAEGGHTAIHPDLGTLEDFRHLVERAGKYGIEVAMDLAFQCAPDHPWVREHPTWFRRRPDGSVQYAENPPKKYEDIYPFDFDTEDWRALWEALRGVVDFWIAQGVRIFRVDNPHTKPFAFWEWLIGEVKAAHPDVLFLSEAFTRPKVMYRLAKLGFTQSYTYFAWRNTAWELREYLTELTRTDVREVFRPNLWPNTPDILTEYLQAGGRPAFAARLVLAATLGASYGIYGPAFELCEHQPRHQGSEEYLDSEKYEIRAWDLDRPGSLAELIERVNRVRRENPALQSDGSLAFHGTDNDQLLCYSKRCEDDASVILVTVNLSPTHTHAGWTDLALEALGLEPDEGFQVHDLLTNARYLWRGARNYVELAPGGSHVFAVRRRIRTEQDFDYYL